MSMPLRAPVAYAAVASAGGCPWLATAKAVRTQPLVSNAPAASTVEPSQPSRRKENLVMVMPLGYARPREADARGAAPSVMHAGVFRRMRPQHDRARSSA